MSSLSVRKGGYLNDAAGVGRVLVVIGIDIVFPPTLSVGGCIACGLSRIMHIRKRQNDRIQTQEKSDQPHLENKHHQVRTGKNKIWGPDVCKICCGERGLNLPLFFGNELTVYLNIPRTRSIVLPVRWFSAIPMSPENRSTGPCGLASLACEQLQRMFFMSCSANNTVPLGPCAQSIDQKRK